MATSDANGRIRTLLSQLGAQDPWRRRHADQVAVYAVATAERLGLDDATLLEIRFAAQILASGSVGEALEKDHESLAQFGENVARWISESRLRQAKRWSFHEPFRDEDSLPVQILCASFWFDIVRNGGPDDPALEGQAFHAEVTEVRNLVFSSDIVDALLAVSSLIQPVRELTA